MRKRKHSTHSRISDLLGVDVSVSSDVTSVRVKAQVAATWPVIPDYTLDFVTDIVNFNINKLLGRVSRQCFEDVLWTFNTMKSRLHGRFYRTCGPGGRRLGRVTDLGSLLQTKKALEETRAAAQIQLGELEDENERLDGLLDHLGERRERLKANPTIRRPNAAKVPRLSRAEHSEGCNPLTAYDQDMIGRLQAVIDSMEGDGMEGDS